MMQQEIYGNGPKKLLIQITNQNHICFMEEVLKTVFLLILLVIVDMVLQQEHIQHVAFVQHFI